MKKTDPVKPDAGAPDLELPVGAEFELSLFDPALPNLWHDDHKVLSGSSACRCYVQVKGRDERGVIVSLPQCSHRGECFQDGRLLYGLAPFTASRTAFCCRVDAPADDPELSCGLTRLTTLPQLHGAERRASYRVPVFPKAKWFVSLWPLRRLEAARSAFDAYLAEEPWDDALREAGADVLEGVVIDISLTGIGLAARHHPDFCDSRSDRLWLVRVDLPGLKRAIPYPVRIRWCKQASCNVTRFGAQFAPGRDKRLTARVEQDLGAWILARQREARQRSPL